MECSKSKSILRKFDCILEIAKREKEKPKIEHHKLSFNAQFEKISPNDDEFSFTLSDDDMHKLHPSLRPHYPDASHFIDQYLLCEYYRHHPIYSQVLTDHPHSLPIELNEKDENSDKPISSLDSASPKDDRKSSPKFNYDELEKLEAEFRNNRWLDDSDHDTHDTEIDDEYKIDDEYNINDITFERLKIYSSEEEEKVPATRQSNDHSPQCL